MQCQHCGRIANPNTGEWVVTCSCTRYLKEADLRKAIEPIADWFDVDGEENDPIALLEVVAESAKMLVEERADLLKMRSLFLELVNEPLPEWMLVKIREILEST